MQYTYSVFIEYMYTCTKSFLNFLNLRGVNGVDAWDVTFTGGGEVDIIATILRRH